MAIESVNGIEMFYKKEGQGPNLLLICGLGRDHTIWEHLVEPLSKHFTVITVDNRGVGSTIAPDEPFTTKDMAKDLECLMDRLGLEDVFVLGHSMGGAIAQELILNHPERYKKLLISSSFAKLNTRSTLLMDTIVQLFEANFPIDMILKIHIGWLFGNATLGNPTYLERLSQGRTQTPQSKEGFKNQVHACKTHDTLHRLGEISVPTHIIVGSEDILTPPESSLAIQKCIKASSLMPYEGVGHMIQYEAAPRLVKDICEFFKGS